jgi:DNA-binding IclR family transcriptional regulator
MRNASNRSRRRRAPSRGNSSLHVTVHRAASRVADILELMAASQEALCLKDLSLKLEAPKSSLLPLLRTLAARGYLEQARAGEYRLGAKVLELGAGSLTQRELPDVARPVLVELMRRTGESVFLGTLASDGAGAVYIDKVESDQLIRYSAGLGARRPLHATAIGKAVLAFQPPKRREEILRSIELVRRTGRTVATLPALRASLEEIRRTGVSINIGEFVPDASGIAGPIFDRDGRVVAACVIGGPTTRIRARVRRLASEVKTAARTISHLLGYREPGDAREARAQDAGASRRTRRSLQRSRS